VKLKLRIATFGFGRVGNVKPGLLVTSKCPSVTGLATFEMRTVLSTPWNVRVAVLEPEPRLTEFVPVPEQARVGRHVKIPPVLNAPSMPNESALATWAESSTAAKTPALTIFMSFLR
jgi:hypothetical protein